MMSDNIFKNNSDKDKSVIKDEVGKKDILFLFLKFFLKKIKDNFDDVYSDIDTKDNDNSLKGKEH